MLAGLLMCAHSACSVSWMLRMAFHTTLLHLKPEPKPTCAVRASSARDTLVNLRALCTLTARGGTYSLPRRLNTRVKAPLQYLALTDTSCLQSERALFEVQDSQSTCQHQLQWLARLHLRHADSKEVPDSAKSQ